METTRRELLPPCLLPNGICAHILAFAPVVWKTCLCSDISILTSQLMSLAQSPPPPGPLKDTTAAILQLSLLHDQLIPLCWIIPLAHKRDVISPILKQTRTKPTALHHPGSSASYFSTSLNSKTTFKNCWYLLSPVTACFSLSPFHEAKSNGQLVFCSSWRLIISSSLKHSIWLPEYSSNQLSAYLTALLSASYYFLFLVSVLVGSILKTHSGLCLYSHLISSRCFK